MVNLTCGKKLCHTCLIGPVILPRVVSKREVLLPTKCVHYASETSIGPFRNPFRMNLRPVKPCAAIKGTGWLKNNSSLIWEFIFNAQDHPKPPSYHLYYICNITTPQAWAFLQTLQCTGWVYPGNIIMLLQGHLFPRPRKTSLIRTLSCGNIVSTGMVTLFMKESFPVCSGWGEVMFDCSLSFYCIGLVNGR